MVCQLLFIIYCISLAASKANVFLPTCLGPVSTTAGFFFKCLISMSFAKRIIICANVT